VAVIEARGRIGGRILSERIGDLPLHAELGAEFVHGRPGELWDLFEPGGMAVFESGGSHWCFDGSLRPCDQTLDSLDSVFEPMHAAPEQTFAQYLAACPCPDELKKWAAGYVEGYNAARKEKISVQSLALGSAAEEVIEGDRIFRILNGYQSVPRFLARGLEHRLFLGTAAAEIRWNPGRVEVETNHGRFEAERAVVTVPLALLRRGTPRFTPVPAALTQFLDAVEPGQAVRVTMRFRERFWERREGMEQLSFLHSLDGAFPTWWTLHPVRAPLLVAWAAGPWAGEFLGRSIDEVAERALDSLARILSLHRSSIAGLLQDCYMHDWHGDPWTGMAYSYVLAGGLDAQRRLSEPVENTLYFAGEATETGGHIGTVHGAMATGRLAARQILRRIPGLP
jgi:monoamine oxidase